MRKALLLLLGLIVMVSFAVGCEKEDIAVPEPDPAEEEWADGTYTGYSEADERGFSAAEVTIENDEIVEVKLEEFEGRGLRKDADFEYDVEAWANARDDYPGEYESISEMFEELEERFVTANTSKIDIITGATGTSEGAIEAVEMALDKARGETGPFDGTFMGISDATERGWSIAIVTVEDAQIVDVELEETQYDDDGNPVLKDEEYGYDEFHEAREEMPEWFIEANSDDVDTYSGATGSSERWKQAVDRALSVAGL